MTEQSPISYIIVDGIERVGFLSLKQYLSYLEDRGGETYLSGLIQHEESKSTVMEPNELQQRIRDYIVREGIITQSGPLPTYDSQP